MTTDLPQLWSALDAGAEATAHDPAKRERQQEAEALLQILAIGDREIEVGQTEPAAAVDARLRERFKSA